MGLLQKLSTRNVQKWCYASFMQKPLLDLPSHHVARPIMGGRSAYEGYQRSSAMDSDIPYMAVWRDPMYQKARAYAVGRSTVMEERRMNIYLLIRFFLKNLPSQNIIEFGSWRGGNAMFMAALLKEYHPKARVWSLDTFTGMPEVDDTVDAHHKGDFENTDLPQIRTATAKAGLDNITFVPGLIQDTAEQVYAEGAPFALAHIDVDIYSAVKFAQETVWQRMCPGGYVVYDDATVSSCLGATQAVEEMIMQERRHSEQIWPHFVFRAGIPDNSDAPVGEK